MNGNMTQETAELVAQHELGNGYKKISLLAPAAAALAKPGQFVHARIPGLDAASLRRPFSIYDAENEILTIVYKQVGRGTGQLASLATGAKIDLIGPLGNGFPMPSEGAVPLLVAGGYGVAPLHFFARKISTPGHLFVGGRTATDILCVDAFEKLSWPVHIATEDGSLGARGRVTDVLLPWIENKKAGADNHNPALLEAFACGPAGMLKALSQQLSIPAWLSLDKHMVCGVGACWACVQKITLSDGAVANVRVCHDGPVFNARSIAW